MTNNQAIERVFKSGFTDPIGDCGKFEASIDVDNWGARIAVYGETAEDAERLRDEVLAKIAAPVVERQPLSFNPDAISAGPGGVTESERLQATCDGLDSQNDALAEEVAALQSTIAQLQARIAELESGR